jgi:hypothetical protein
VAPEAPLKANQKHPLHLLPLPNQSDKAQRLADAKPRYIAKKELWLAAMKGAASIQMHEL